MNEIDKIYKIMKTGAENVKRMQDASIMLLSVMMGTIVLVTYMAYSFIFTLKIEMMYPVYFVLFGLGVCCGIIYIVLVVSKFMKKTQVTPAIYSVVYVFVLFRNIIWVAGALCVHYVGEGWFYIAIIISFLGCIIECVILKSDIKRGVYEKNSNMSEKRLPIWGYGIIIITFIPLIASRRRHGNVDSFGRKVEDLYLLYLAVTLNIVVSRFLLKLCIYIKNVGKLSKKEKKELFGGK